MRFELDENIPVSLAARFAAAGHEASTAFDRGLEGIGDEALVGTCRDEQRILVTLDAGFVDGPHAIFAGSPGAIVLCPARQDTESITELIQRLIAEVERTPPDGRVLIVDGGGVRVSE